MHNQCHESPLYLNILFLFCFLFFVLFFVFVCSCSVYSRPKVTVPGAAAGCADAVAKWGSGHLSLSQILEPAAVLAEGAPVAPIAAHFWREV